MNGSDEAWISHGQTTHNLRDAKKCEDCIEVDKEWTELVVEHEKHNDGSKDHPYIEYKDCPFCLLEERKIDMKFLELSKHKRA